MGIYIRNNRLVGGKVKNGIKNINTDIIQNHVNTSTVNKLLNKSSSSDKSVFSSSSPYGGPGDAGVWVRNTSCWLNGVNNISCFSPAQRSGANWFQRAGTLITRKHFILAKHFTFALLEGGTGIIFVDENNNAIKRNLIQYAFDPITDIAIGLLDNEVPSNIKIAKVLPTNYYNYIKLPLLAVGLDQEEKALLKVWTGFLNYKSTLGESYQYASVDSVYSSAFPQYANYTGFSETMIVGDSGNPIFVIIDNTLVLLGCWTTPISGPFITNRYSKVNELIESLSPNQGYSLSPIDLELVYHKYR